MTTLSTIATLYADAKTLSDVQDWYTSTQMLGLDEATAITDGANAQVTGLDRPIGTYPTACLKDVAIWLELAAQKGISADATMSKPALDLAVDLPVKGAELPGCGDCPGQVQDLLVHLHDGCQSEWAEISAEL